MIVMIIVHYLIVGTTDIEDTVPYNEEELATLYPNAQLDANEQFIEYFIHVSHTIYYDTYLSNDIVTQASQQDQHELYKLLITYLKERQALVVLQCKIEVSACVFLIQHPQTYTHTRKFKNCEFKKGE